MAHRPDVSVIVPVRDENHYLSKLLDALAGQTIESDRFEVILADDGSERPPPSIESDSCRIVVLPGPRTNSYAARNRAVAAARAPILAFCDVDCVPAANWLDEGLRALETSDLVAGQVQFLLPPRRSVWTLVDVDTSKNQELLVSLGVAETANLFLRRELFDAASGFDENVPDHGDYDLVERCVAAGHKLAFAPGALVRHPTRDRARDVLTAHWRYCAGYAQRRAMRRQPVEGLKLRNWVPVVGIVRGRRRVGSPLTGGSTWLATNGIEPTFRERIVSLPITYLLLPYWRNVAQVVGAARGRRQR